MEAVRRPRPGRHHSTVKSFADRRKEEALAVKQKQDASRREVDRRKKSKLRDLAKDRQSKVAAREKRLVQAIAENGGAVLKPVALLIKERCDAARKRIADVFSSFDVDSSGTVTPVENSFGQPTPLEPTPHAPPFHHSQIARLMNNKQMFCLWLCALFVCRHRYDELRLGVASILGFSLPEEMFQPLCEEMDYDASGDVDYRSSRIEAVSIAEYSSSRALT